MSFGLSESKNVADESQDGAENNAYSAAQIAVMDLNAQRSMAHWATMLAWLTFAGAGILIATLLETANATDAAQDTTRETRRIGEAQGRAYVSVEPTGAALKEYELRGIKRKSAVINFRVRALGNTPAYSIHCDVKAWFQDTDINPASERNRPVLLVGNSHPYCHPGDSCNFRFSGGGHGLDMMDWPRLFREVEAQSLVPQVQFHIRVFWTDVFNVELSQRFDVWARIAGEPEQLVLDKLEVPYTGPIKRFREKNYDD